MRWSAWESVKNAVSKRADRSLTIVLLASLQLLLLSPFRVARPQAPAVPAERLAAREWFRQAGFGLFIHWGVYSQLGAGEWVMQNREIPAATYEWLASEFNPVKFDAHEWVSLARTAGARYITITSRHHDGFSMFATKATSYNIVEASPFKRDPLKELADECHRQGIKLFFYYSQLDPLSRNEIDQIGYRLANELGHRAIYAVDVDGDFPWQRVVNYAKANGVAERFEAINAGWGTMVKEQADFFGSHTVLETLQFMNSDSRPARDMALYFALVRYGDPFDYAGSDLLAAWYQGNIRIYRNIVALIDSPNEKILVLYGSGHLGWLRQDIANDATVRLRKLADLTEQH